MAYPHPTSLANANKNSQDDITSSFSLGSGLATTKPNGFSGHRISVADEQSMLERNRVIFREVSRDQLFRDYYLLVLYMSGACSNTSSVGFWTRARANRGHRARSSILRVLEKSYLSTRKRLGGRSTLEQGSTPILRHLGNDCARVARVRSSRASMVVPMLEQSEDGCSFARARRA